MSRKQRPDPPDNVLAPAPPINTPFAKLAGLRAEMHEAARSAATSTAPIVRPASTARPSPPPPAKAAPPPPAKPAPAVIVTTPPPGVAGGPARAVVRYERAGRRGKEVTIVAKLGLPVADLDAWLRALKQSLGVGGVLEGEEIVLQGDCRSRLVPLLTSRGVRKITLG